LAPRSDGTQIEVTRPRKAVLAMRDRRWISPIGTSRVAAGPPQARRTIGRPPQALRTTPAARAPPPRHADCSSRGREEDEMSQLTVRELMKTPTTVVRPNQTLASARDEMQRAGVHHLPVVDGSGVLLGLVSQRDVERVMGLMAAAEGLRQPLTVGDITSGEGPRATPELPAHQAASIMIESHTDGLPIVDPKGKLVGILTSTDLLEVAREALMGLIPGQRARA
jgi:CBS domain-containing protein